MFSRTRAIWWIPKQCSEIWQWYFYFTLYLEPMEPQNTLVYSVLANWRIRKKSEDVSRGLLTTALTGLNMKLFCCSQRIMQVYSLIQLNSTPQKGLSVSINLAFPVFYCFLLKKKNGTAACCPHLTKYFNQLRWHCFYSKPFCNLNIVKWLFM